MPRSRSVVERTSALGPASVRTVSLRAGIASMRILQLMGRRAMDPTYARDPSIRKPNLSAKAGVSTDVLVELGRRPDQRVEIAAFSVGVLEEPAPRVAALHRERLAAGLADAVLRASRGAEDAPAHLTAVLASHQYPHR